MDQAEYERMVKIYNYVYSTLPNTPEREKRLAEIGEEDSQTPLAGKPARTRADPAGRPARGRHSHRHVPTYVPPRRDYGVNLKRQLLLTNDLLE